MPEFIEVFKPFFFRFFRQLETVPKQTNPVYCWKHISDGRFERKWITNNLQDKSALLKESIGKLLL